MNGRTGMRKMTQWNIKPAVAGRKDCSLHRGLHSVLSPDAVLHTDPIWPQTKELVQKNEDHHSECLSCR